jgi:hypothetical protein
MSLQPLLNNLMLALTAAITHCNQSSMPSLASR